MNDGERSNVRPMIQFASGQLIALDLIGHRVPWKDCDAGIDFQGSLDGFNIVEFHDDGNFNTSSTQDFVGGLSGGNVFLEGNEILPTQVLHGEIFFLGEGVLRIHRHDELVLSKVDGGQFLVVHGECD